MKGREEGQRSHFRKPGAGSRHELAPLRGSRKRLSKRVIFPDNQRNRGLHLVAASGSGKSLALGYLAYLDLLRGTPQIILDPMGQAVDALLLRVSQLPRVTLATSVNSVTVSPRMLHHVRAQSAPSISTETAPSYWHR